MDFNFKEIDREGWETLQVIHEAHRLNRWMYDTIRPFCSGNILEIGSGIGNISQYFLEAGNNITLSDIRSSYTGVLQQQFGRYPNLKGILQMNITDPQFAEKYAAYFGTFDAVFSLNVVEHIEDDMLAVANCSRLLKPGGRLVILVPAYQALYNRFDRELEHYRRYTVRTLAPLFTGNGLRIIHKQYFNCAGILGWYVSGKLQRNKQIPGKQMKLYNALVPVFKLVDRLVLHKTGLSVVIAGEK